MKRAIAATALVLASISPDIVASQARAQVQPQLQNSQIEIAYVQPNDRGYQAIYDLLKKRQVLEELQRFLTPLRLSRKLTVKIDECGGSTRPYKPQGPVTICYELVDQIEKIAAKVDPSLRATATAGAFIMVVLHEVAHAIFDIEQVPVWGRVEDAADRLAALVMLQFGEDLAVRTIFGTTVFFNASEKTWTGSDFSDVSSPEEQRYYNYLCIAYGGAPISFQALVTPDQNGEQTLPDGRAVRCAKEYAQVLKAFNLRIMPFVDPNLLVAVRSTQWLLPTDIR
jgi:hypothetical protein